MDALTYRGGPPPAEGWWPTEHNAVEDVSSGFQEYRYWHGHFWSIAADCECTEAQAEMVKTLHSTRDDIRWRGWMDTEREGRIVVPVVELPNADLF